MVRKVVNIATLSVHLRIEIHFTYGIHSFALLCDSLSVTPKIIAWAQAHEIEISDPIQLGKLFQTRKQAVDYIKENRHKLIDQTKLEKYTNVYVSYLENEVEE